VKLERMTVRWEKAIEIHVLVPEGMTVQEVAAIAENVDVDSWSSDGWEAWVTATHAVELPEEHRRLAPRTNIAGREYLDVVKGSALDSHGFRDTLVISDDKNDFVDATDASWWLAKDGVES